MWVNTLRDLGVDAVQQLAICKVAASKPSSQRLDCIKSQLAPVLGMKHRMTGAKALPHPSVFLDKFKSALEFATLSREEEVPEAMDFYRRVRDQLAEEFGDPEQGTLAFKSAMAEFLRKTGKMPPSPLRSRVQMFFMVDALDAQAKLKQAELDPEAVPRPGLTRRNAQAALHAKAAPGAAEAAPAKLEAWKIVELFGGRPLQNDGAVRKGLVDLGAEGESEMAAYIGLARAYLPLGFPPKTAQALDKRMDAFLLTAGA